MRLHTNTQDFNELIRLTATHFSILPEFIEKDYWITDFSNLWTNLRSTYQNELIPLAFSEIPNEKLIEKSFMETIKKTVEK